MDIIKLSEGFIMYQFPPEATRILGQNIFVLYSEGECIIFDAGYERHMEELKPFIKGYKIKYVICTHFHPDHCFGLNTMTRQTLIGSKYAIYTLSLFECQDNDLLVPSIVVDDKMEIQFHGHIIKLKLNPGHSNCGMLIDIDDEYLLLGDEYMTTNKGEPVLPFVAETVTQHLKALEFIMANYHNYKLLPSHGKITSNHKDLEYRVRYLNFCLTNEKNINYFYTSDGEHYLNEKWHKQNLKKI